MKLFTKVKKFCEGLHGTEKNLWFLTEERPKKEVIIEIVKKICKDRKSKVSFSKIRFIPVMNDDKFCFMYEVIGIEIDDFKKILIKTVSGDSSFTDFIIYFSEKDPTPKDIPAYAIEETKTDDSESRNTGVYQRCSKFVYVDLYYPRCKKIMLYNIRVKKNKYPTETNIFGTRMLLTLGVEILGKNLDFTIFKPFKNIDEFIELKSNMRRAPAGNISILIKKYVNKITISGRLFKSGGLSHDPNIGALSVISKTLRILGWTKEIVIIRHGLSKNHLGRDNKFIKIANAINIKLDRLTVPKTELPADYWHYEKNSEKLATIFLHLLIEEQENISVIYENHAGCERGYFINADKEMITVHKYIQNNKENGIVNIPDMVICDNNKKEILDIEGKTYNNRLLGVAELNNLDAFENEYVKKYYPQYKISRWVVIYGGTSTSIDNQKIALLLNNDGCIIVTDTAPEIIKTTVKELKNFNKKQ